VPKKVCLINDLSGLGRCSLTVALPIISAMGHQAVPLPTAVLSAHTGFKHYSFVDLTRNLDEYINVWNKLEFNPQVIYSGFLGSSTQIDMVSEFLDNHKHAVAVVDPVMGDDGVIYKTYNERMCQKLLKLCLKAYVITPNLTEAYILADKPYNPQPTDEEIRQLLTDLYNIGINKVVITGIPHKNRLANAIMDGGEIKLLYTEKTDIKVNGTGDIFASVLTGALAKGDDLCKAVKLAGEFTAAAVKYTKDNGFNPIDGVAFEPLLYSLCNEEK